MRVDPIVNIMGDSVSLGPLRQDLLSVYTRWRNDFAVAHTMDYTPTPFTSAPRSGQGESDARGRGVGTEVTRLVLDYAFTILGLHNVMLRVYSYNFNRTSDAGSRACGETGP